MRLAAIEMLHEAAGAGGFRPRPEILFTTSLMSLTDLRALLPPALRVVPCVLYMHENQAAYPRGHTLPEAGQRDVHFALTNLTSILAADLVIFNSEWNRRSFAEGIAAVLAHAPDARLDDPLRRLDQRSTVIWPPVEPPPGEIGGSDTGIRGSPGAADRVLHNPTRVVWPHRWEHDKGPETLLRLAHRYTEPANLRWTILGEQFRDVPPAMAEFRRRMGHRIDHMGFEPDRRRYWQRLASGDWVLSTARHEFFGIAVVEALLAGCLPWLPDRLSYPELLPPPARGLSPMRPPEDPERIRVSIRAHLEPALAANAVAALDEAIDRVAVETDRSGV